MEFARLVERCIEGVLALLAPMTVASIPQASLVSRHSLGAGRSLGERLHVVKPQMDV
jgi:hypothetical protein